MGASGDKLAKQLGRSDGSMPMAAWIPGDIEPCDECKKKGIGIVEVTDGDTNMLTGRRWLVHEEAIERIVDDEKLKENILKKRVVVMPEKATEALGLRDIFEGTDKCSQSSQAQLN